MQFDAILCLFTVYFFNLKRLYTAVIKQTMSNGAQQYQQTKHTWCVKKLFDKLKAVVDEDQMLLFLRSYVLTQDIAVFIYYFFVRQKERIITTNKEMKI